MKRVYIFNSNDMFLFNSVSTVSLFHRIIMNENGVTPMSSTPVHNTTSVLETFLTDETVNVIIIIAVSVLGIIR